MRPLYSVVFLSLFTAAIQAQDQDKSPAELAKLPMYERMLKGDDAKKAAELEENYDKAVDAEDWDEAKKHAQALLDFRTQKQGPDHWEATDARQMLLKVDVRARLAPEERRQLDQADQQNQQLVALRQKGQFGAAVQLGEQIVVTRKKLLGENHPLYALSLNNLALLYKAMGEYAKAEPLLLQARDLRKKLVGENHPSYAVSLNNLAGLYKTMGDYVKAEPLYLQARDLFKKLVGENHPDYALSGAFQN